MFMNPYRCIIRTGEERSSNLFKVPVTQSICGMNASQQTLLLLNGKRVISRLSASFFSGFFRSRRGMRLWMSLFYPCVRVRLKQHVGIDIREITNKMWATHLRVLRVNSGKVNKSGKSRAVCFAQMPRRCGSLQLIDKVYMCVVDLATG